MRKTYEQMHSGLHWAKGRASDHTCIDCKNPAQDWAFRYPDQGQLTDEQGRKYSENFDDYEPMCRSCHRRYDMSQPERQAYQQAHLQRVNAEAAKDPEYSALMRERGLKGLESMKLKRAQGESLGKRSEEGLAELGRQVGNLRRTCNDCGMETAAGPLVRHQKTSGHEGWTAA